MKHHRLVGLLAGALLLASCVPDSVKHLFSSNERVAENPGEPGSAGRSTIVILDRGNSRGTQTYAADLFAVGKQLGFFVTQVTDPVPMPVTIWEGTDDSWKDVGVVDVPAISTESTGWIFSRPGAAPRYQPPGPKDEMIGAAAAYFGQDLASALPWRAVVAITGQTDARFDYQVEEIHRFLDPRSIYLVTWQPGDATPVSFPEGSTPVGSVDPKAVTKESTGWVLVEKGKDPQYVPAGSIPELLRNASSYFGMDFQSGRAGVLNRMAKTTSRIGLNGRQGARGPAAGPRKRQLKGPRGQALPGAASPQEE
jgi:hypothetical protein